MKSRLITIISVISLLHFSSVAQDNQESIDQRIDSYLTSSAKNGYSGTVLVARKGEVVFSKGYGWANRSKKIPNQPSIVYNIGSVTKQFTAAAILKLMEEGKLETSGKITQYFPEAPSDKKNITIHQLLTHTSGISPRTGGFRYDEASKEQFLIEFFSSKLMYEPGAKHTYANANYIVLAAIVEAVSEQDYESFLRENFWTPLEMNHTGYKSITFDSERLAHGYDFEMKSGEWKDWGITQEHLTYSENHWYSIGKGDIYSTVEDLFKWHSALQANEVLDSTSKQLMETAFVAENERETSHYGYGWAILSSPEGDKIVTHNGSNGVFFADFIRNVDEDLAIIVLSNVLINRESGNVGWEIARMISSDTYTPKVIPKNSYELVFSFMHSNSPDSADQLVDFLLEETGKPLREKALLNRIGFTQIAEKLNTDWGIALLKLNTEIFPDDGNLWDTLGEAYFLLDDKENATISFQKALELRPENNCYWCENSSKRLKELTGK